MSLDLAILVVVCFLNLLLGALVFLRNPKSRIGLEFLLITLFICGWSASNYLTENVTILTYSVIFNSLAYFFAFAAVFCIAILTYNFPVARQVPRLALRAALFAAPSVLILSLTPLVAGKVTLAKSGDFVFLAGPLLPIYALLLLGLLSVIVVNLLRVVRRYRGREHEQAKLMLLGFVFAITSGLLTNVVVPSLVDDWASAKFGPLLTLVIVATISYAIVKHGLFDIRLTVARSLAYLLSIVAVAVLYAMIAFSISTLFLEGNITLGQEIFFATFSAIVALVFQPIKRVFDRVTNHLFYQDAYDSQVFIDQLNRALVLYTDLNRLLTESSTIIRDNFKAEFCLFDINNPTVPGNFLLVGSDKKEISKEDILREHIPPRLNSSVVVADNLNATESGKFKAALEKNGVAVVVRLTTSQHQSDATLGYLIMGNKKSGNPFNSQDVRLLEIIANSLVIALQNAYRFEEIQNFNITLQEKVEEATRKLRRTNDKLRKLDETKDEFISMASHQLRTPLTSVKGYVSMVLDGDGGKINSLQRKLLDQSFMSAQRMVYIISDLLNVSRLKTGKFLIEATSTDLASVVQQEVEQLQPVAKDRHLELIYHKPEHFPTCMLDETKIRQVIMNFIDNAIYYTPSGGKIEVSLFDRPHSIELHVTDNGIGVPKHDQHHLFSKFYRAHNAQRARPDGTGLGLFMAKKVIIAQGGAIIFKSKEGQGSTFGFTFPKNKLSPSQSAPSSK